MRIAHVTATFPPYYAGAGNACFHNACLLAERGHKITVYTAKTGNEASGPMNAFDVKRLPSLWRIGNAPLTLGLLTLPRYDLIHLHYPFIFGADLVWVNSLLHDQPYVVTYHNDLIWRGFKGLMFKLYQTINARIITQGAQRIITGSWDFAQSSPTLRHLTKVPGKVTEVPYGVDTSRFHPNLDGWLIRDKYGIEKDAVLIVFVGAMDRAHHLKGGVPQLLQAVARLCNDFIFVALIGGGSMIPVYEDIAGEMGIASHVFFTGFVTDDDLGRYYAAADLVVQPSVLFETFGLAVIEAMACGKPVIASNLPGVRSVVSDGEDGLLVRPGDVDDLAEKIQMLLDDPQRRREMGERGRAKVEEKYAWPKIIPRLVQVYEEVLTNATADG